MHFHLLLLCLKDADLWLEMWLHLFLCRFVCRLCTSITCYLVRENYFVQGDCKHTIVIRDMRLVHPEDVQNQAAYPIVVFQLKPRVQKCHVCKIYRATKVTVDDKWAQGNPCYFCDNCYYLLHYKDGSLVYSDFSVYDYLHD